MSDNKQKAPDGKYTGINRLFDSAGSLGSPLTTNANLGFAPSASTGAAAAAGSSGFDEMIDSLVMMNILNTQQAAQHHQSQQQQQSGVNQFAAAAKPSSSGGVIGATRPGVKPNQREITSDFDLSLSSTGSSLDSPPQDAITTLTHLGLLGNELGSAAASAAISSAAAAAQTMLHVRTPMIESRGLTRALGIAGCKVWIKLENTQPTGSFKLRGIGFMVKRAVERGCNQIISSSGGNAGLAAAYAAKKLGVSCTVVVPETTPELMRARIEDEGANVLVHGSVWSEAHSKAELLAQNSRAVLVHPYEHEDIWAGHSTIIDEVAESLNGEQPDGIVVAVGGGGLLSGIIAGLWQHNWHSTPVIAAETIGANCLAAAIAAGKPVALPTIASKATSLGATQLSQQAWDCMRKHPVHSTVCSDEEASQAAINFLNQHQLLTELACGAALAAVYKQNITEQQLLKSQPKNLIVIVCGGRNVTVNQLLRIAGDVPV